MSFALTRRSAILGAATAATAVAVPGIIPRQRAAHASAPGQAGRITFKRNGSVYLAEADGSGAHFLQVAGGGPGNWAPDGSRFVYGWGASPASMRPDGTETFIFFNNSVGFIEHPVYAYDGRYVVYSYFSKLSITAASGSWDGGSQLFSVPDDGKVDTHPAVAGDGTIVFQHGYSGSLHDTEIHRVDDFTTVNKIIDGGWAPDFSPDSSKLAFVRTSAAGDSDQIWIADADGANQVQLTTVDNTGSAKNQDPVWSPEGDTVLFTSWDAEEIPSIKRIAVSGGDATLVVAEASEPTCQPLNPNYVERVWGQTALGTAVATSRYNFADKGVEDGIRVPAKAVVLSRDDIYYDALGGSALAVSKQAPLLITPTGSLHGQTQAEIQRILGDTGTVYLLGGTVALSANVENQLKALGYQTVRLWGQTEYDTAVAVAKAITPNPTAVIVATSLKYYDALAAGAAAGANPGTVIVLTAGDTMPAATARYLDTLNPDPDSGTAMIGVGGPGVRALLNGYRAGQMPNWPSPLRYYDVSGATEFETAIAVADFFFTGPRTAAVATATTWYDALTGGAMIGGNSGPLLLSAPHGLSYQTLDYMSRNSSTISYGVLLGGPLALQDTLVGMLGDAISVPGFHKYVQYTETYTVPPPKGKALAASTALRGAAAGRTKEIPGVKQQRPSTTDR